METMVFLFAVLQCATRHGFIAAFLKMASFMVMAIWLNGMRVLGRLGSWSG